jgi:predicted signal transduction protein with EAL and GGDEF domain
MGIHGEVIQIGTSVGIAMFPADERTSVDLINNADTAMYASKASDKNIINKLLPPPLKF